jgi:hypothetical protein
MTDVVPTPSTPPTQENRKHYTYYKHLCIIPVVGDIVYTNDHRGNNLYVVTEVNAKTKLFKAKPIYKPGLYDNLPFGTYNFDVAREECVIADKTLEFSTSWKPKGKDLKQPRDFMHQPRFYIHHDMW